MSVNDPLIGQQLGNFRIERLLGRGGMASVYYGVDIHLQRPSAIKVIDERFQGNPAFAQRFLREARAMAAWQHPNIPRVYSAGEQNGLYYYGMEYIDGQDLKAVMQQYADRGELMSYADVLRIGRAVADALDYAHEKGAVHRDVKPANVLIARDGRVFLTDFGLVMQTTEGTRGEVFGSPHYISPEQARSSAQAVPQSDLYSLGVMMYEMLVGERPFEDESPVTLALKHVNQPPPPPTEINPELGASVEAVLLKVLSKQPAARFATGKAFMAALSNALAPTIPMSPSPRPPAHHTQTTRPSAVPARPPVQQSPARPPVGGETRPMTPQGGYGYRGSTQALPPDGPQYGAYNAPPPAWQAVPPPPAGPTYPPRSQPTPARGSGRRIGCALFLALAAVICVVAALAARPGDWLSGLTSGASPIVTQPADAPPVTEPPVAVEPSLTPTPEPAEPTPDYDATAAAESEAIVATNAAAATAIVAATQQAEAENAATASALSATQTAGAIDAQQTATAAAAQTAAAGDAATATAAQATAGAAVTVVPILPDNVADQGHLLLAMNKDDSLFVVNLGPTLPLEALVLSNNQGEVQGSEWEVENLQTGKCVAVWKEEGKAKAPKGVKCDLVGERLQRSGSEKYWTSSFDVFYQGEKVGECNGERNGGICEIRFPLY